MNMRYLLLSVWGSSILRQATNRACRVDLRIQGAVQYTSIPFSAAPDEVVTILLRQDGKRERGNKDARCWAGKYAGTSGEAIDSGGGADPG